MKEERHWVPLAACKPPVLWLCEVIGTDFSGIGRLRKTATTNRHEYDESEEMKWPPGDPDGCHDDLRNRIESHTRSAIHPRRE
jgi:hypothetical protein